MSNDGKPGKGASAAKKSLAREHGSSAKNLFGLMPYLGRYRPAIAWGMLAATLFGLATGRLREPEAMRMMRLIGSVGPVPSLTGIRAAQLRPILAGDKKARGGRVLWVLPRRLGKAEWGIDLPWTLVSRTFAELPRLSATAKS